MTLQETAKRFFFGVISYSATVELAELLSVSDVVLEGFEFEFVGLFCDRTRNSSEFLAVFEMPDFSGFFFFKTIDFFEHEEAVCLVGRFYVFLVDVFVVVLFFNQQVANHFFVHLYL